MLVYILSPPSSVQEAAKSDAGRQGPDSSLEEGILLAACGANEMLPQNPDLPADVFTSCLTTPIKVHSSLQPSLWLRDVALSLFLAPTIVLDGMTNLRD